MGFLERLETERLVLRRWRAGDREAMAAIWSDPQVWRALRPGRRFDPAYGPARFDHHLRHWDEHGFGTCAVELAGDRQVIGWAGPSHPRFVPELADRVEVGWTLRPAFWGQGLASEAAAAALAACFAAMHDVDELISLIHPANRRSAAVARRVGMRHTRDVRHPELEQELHVYAVGRLQWETLGATRPPGDGGRPSV